MVGGDGQPSGRRGASRASDRHAAFISYSQADKAEVKKLQHWLETYRVPRSLRTANDRPSGKLGRIFRDDEDMSAASDIAAQVREAIERSDALIVACSPRAAKSKWVEAEIQHFRKTGREGRIFAVILDGEPNSPDPVRECFPPSFRRGGAYEPSLMPIEPLALDMNKDGRERVRARLAAGLLGVGFDEVWNRERRRQRARAALAGGLLAAGIALTSVAGVATWLALDNNAKAEAARIEAEAARGEAEGARGEATVARTDAETNRAQAEEHLARAVESEAAAADALVAADSAAKLANENLAHAADQRAATFASEAGKLVSGNRLAEAMLMALYGDPAAQDVEEAVKGLRPQGLMATREALVQAFAARPLLTLSGHSGVVTSAAFSNDGTRIVTASGDRTMRVWDAATAKLKLTIDEAGPVHSAVFSPDGTRIVTASDDETVRLWDAETGKLLQTLEGHAHRVRSAAFAREGTRIVADSLDGARVWDVESGSSLVAFSGKGLYVTAAALSPDGSRIVTATGELGSDIRVADIWDVRSGESLVTLVGHSSDVTSVAFSPDGSRIATGAGDLLSPSGDNTVRVWNASTGKVLVILSGHSNRINSVAFSPDGYRIATASDDGTARIWDAATGKLFTTLSVHAHDTRSAAFSPDGTRIVTASFDHTARVWNAKPTFHLKPAAEQVRLACARLKEMGIYDFAPEERAKLLILNDVPSYPCGAPPPGVPAWPEGGPKY